MDSNKEDIIVNYPKSFILGSKFSYSINPKTKYSFIDNLIPLEKQKQDERDYRLAINMLRGTGRIHDIVDPNLNCSEKTWISTEFKLNQGNVEINGDINNIDKEYFPNLYVDIKNIFQEMLPNINKVKDLSEFKTVNVNVKIQSYQITKNQTYEGQFHQEGYRDEGIILVALYYFSVSQNLKGGNLELKYVKNKEFRKEYGCMDNTFEIKSFFVKEDDMIVFLNRNCEHRINRLESIYPSENSINERKVLVFFICNPEKSCIPTTKNVNYNLKCKSIQKDIAYVKRDEFRNSRFVNEKNKVDYFSDEDIPKKNLILNKDILLQNEINFKVNIKDLTGKKYSISIQPNDSVERLKDLIYLQSTVPQDQMRLIFAGKQLEDYFSLDYYHIENEDSIHLVKRLVGD